MEDPYFSVREDVELALAQARTLHDDYVRRPTSALQSELRSLLDQIALDLRDLTETVELAEAQPFRFPLAPTELAARKSFLASVSSHLATWRASLTANPQARAALFAGSPVRPSPMTPSLQGREPEDEMHYQDMVMSNQDHQLGQVSQTVGQLKNIALQIGDTVDDQTRLIDDVNDMAETTGNRMSIAMNRVNVLLNTSDAATSLSILCCIFMLLLLLLLLLIL